MKTMKKIGALVLAVVMCMSVSMVALAADDDETTYSITVENSIGGVTYSAYKVFDATYSGDAVTYSIESSSAWYSAVSGSELFTLTEIGTSTTYQVTKAENASDKDIIGFLNDTFATISATAAATGTGTGSALALTVSGAGYYYITTSNEGAVASVTTAAPTATVVDKNQKPGSDFSKSTETTSASVGDSVTYTIGSYVPTYDGEDVVTSYTITDTMGAGLTLNYTDDKPAVTVTISGTGLEEAEDITNYCTITAKPDAEGNTVLTITWSPATIEAVESYTYPADATVTVTYTDTVNEAADDLDLANEAAITWLKGEATEADEEDKAKAETTIYTYGFDLKKTDASNNTLTGAEFTLSAAESSDAITFLYDETSDTYKIWDGTTSGTTTTTITVANGEVNVWGLAAGTYTLTETKAPDGYNLLTSPITITIAATETGWTVTVNNGTPASGVLASGSDHGVSSMPTVTVVNQAGSSLPSTGGMGTTIFYIVGGVIVLAAVVLLVARRRTRREAE